MFLRIVHILGLTNLTNDDVEHYERLQAESHRRADASNGTLNMVRWSKNIKLQFVTILIVNIGLIILALAILAGPMVGLRYLGLGIVALGLCSIFLLAMIMRRQRGPMLQRLDDQLKLTNQAEQHARKLEEESAVSSAIAQKGFEADLAQKDALRTSELAALRKELGNQESLLEKERDSFEKAWKTVRQIAADASEAQHVLRQCDSAEKLADANRRVDRFMQDSTDWCKETYEPLWGYEAPCRVLVKYLVDEHNMCLMFRDRQSGRVDKGAQRRRRIDQYTSYGDIYHNRRPYFFSHDLVALKANDGYSNPKKNWQDLYKTELVVPIGKVDTSDGCGRDLVGFLAIASLKTNIMHKERDLEIALTIASHIYDVLAGLYTVKRASEQQQESKGGAVEDARRMDLRKGGFGNASA